MRYKVAIRRNADGVVRLYDFGPDIPWGDGTVWWLTEGNFGCDCNREMDFRRAGGEDGGEPPCGNTRYSILYAELEDGQKIAVDEPLPVD